MSCSNPWIDSSDVLPDEELLEDLEGALLSADLGACVVDRLMQRVREETRGADAKTSEGLQNVLSRSLYGVLKTSSRSLNGSADR